MTLRRALWTIPIYCEQQKVPPIQFGNVRKDTINQNLQQSNCVKIYKEREDWKKLTAIMEWDHCTRSYKVLYHLFNTHEATLSEKYWTKMKACSACFVYSKLIKWQCDCSFFMPCTEIAFFLLKCISILESWVNTRKSWDWSRISFTRKFLKNGTALDGPRDTSSSVNPRHLRIDRLGRLILKFIRNVSTSRCQGLGSCGSDRKPQHQREEERRGTGTAKVLTESAAGADSENYDHVTDASTPARRAANASVQETERTTANVSSSEPGECEQPENGWDARIGATRHLRPCLRQRW